MVKGGED